MTKIESSSPPQSPSSSMLQSVVLGALGRGGANFSYVRVLGDPSVKGSVGRYTCGMLPTALQVVLVRDASVRADGTVLGQLGAGVMPAIYSSFLMQPPYRMFVRSPAEIKSVVDDGSRRIPWVARMARMGLYQNAALLTEFCDTARINKSVAFSRLFPSFSLGVAMRWSDWAVLFAVQKKLEPELGFHTANAVGIGVSTTLSCSLYVVMFDGIASMQKQYAGNSVVTLRQDMVLSLREQWHALCSIKKFFVAGTGMWPRFGFACLGTCIEKAVVTLGVRLFPVFPEEKK